jgi:hypothetical protein
MSGIYRTALEDIATQLLSIGEQLLLAEST